MVSRSAIALFHICIVGLLFLYIGFARDQVPEFVFHVLGVLAAFMMLYHLYLAYFKLKDNKSAWIHWIHILLVAPLLFLLAYLKKDAHRRYFEMLLMLGFAAVGYNTLSLIRDNIFS